MELAERVRVLEGRVRNLTIALAAVIIVALLGMRYVVFTMRPPTLHVKALMAKDDKEVRAVLDASGLSFHDEQGKLTAKLSTTHAGGGLRFFDQIPTSTSGPGAR